MNEDRNREEHPGPPRTEDEFARMRGEVQHHGTRVLAVPPPEPPAPVGIAPPDPRNVVSNFDTRPIGAYDFAHSGHVTMGNGEVTTFASVNFSVPDGYTAVLRRIRVEFTPPASMQVAQPAAGASPTNTFLMSILRNEAVVPNNTVELLGALDVFEWDTHQVYGFWESMGLRLVQATSFAIPANVADAVFVGVTFFGVLIPTKSKPPAIEIASDPVVVRDYDTFSKEPPQTGAAGSDR